MPGPHQIDAVVPNHGVVGQQVDIQGTGFGATQGVSTVLFSPNEVASVILWSDTLITVTVPAGAVTGDLRVVVGGQDPLSPRNADFFWLDLAAFPGALDSIEFQNVQNDSDIGGFDDLALADARDFNKVAEVLLRTQAKLGADASADPGSVDNRLLGPQRLIIEEFETLPPAAAPPPLAVPAPFSPAGSLHTFLDFNTGVDSEILFRMVVPRKVKAGSALGIVPVFQIDTPPNPADDIALELFGDLNGTALPATGGVSVVVDAFAPGAFIAVPPVFVIPVDGAPPVAPADGKLALRFQRLGTGDAYGGKFLLDHLRVEWVR